MNLFAKASVVMATFNGERYLKDQISSILTQLEVGDELIVVDDASTDTTISIAQSFNADQMKIIRNEKNIGVVASFERGLMLARNDYIFLSDQDDIWMPGKRNAYIAEFERSPNITTVISDLIVIDADAKVISVSFMEGKGGFKGGIFDTLWRNRYIGCSMAMKRTILDILLPFPKGLPMHDMWIGIVGKALGSVCYLSIPYMQYRRHGSNVTSLNRFSLTKMILLRMRLFASMFHLACRLSLTHCQRVRSNLVE